MGHLIFGIDTFVTRLLHFDQALGDSLLCLLAISRCMNNCWGRLTMMNVRIARTSRPAAVLNPLMGNSLLFESRVF